MGPKVVMDMKITVKEVIKELLSDEDFINRILAKVTSNIHELETRINEQDKKIQYLESRLDDCKQHEKRNHVCLYGIPEEDDENIRRKMMQIFKDTMKISLTSDDIERVYRVGERKGQKERPVIIALGRYQNKKKLFDHRKHLKGSKMVICGDLTPRKLELLSKLGKKFGRRNIYSFDGNIYVKMGDKRKKISSVHDFSDLEGQDLNA